MDPRYRPLFNQQFSEELYGRMSRMMDERLAQSSFEFRLAESPLMLPPPLRARCETVAREILEIIRRPEIIARCARAIPARYDCPRPDPLPHFVAIDLAIVRGPDGELEPRLIELQGFASLYGMQLVQSGIWGEVLASIPGMPSRWTSLFSGLTPESYVQLLGRTVLAGSPPDDVILLDLDPETQKTRPDFHATARLLGVRTVNMRHLRREGRRLLAPRDDRLIPVRRILHRVVFDELERSQVEACFDYRDDLDVVWVSHPNWYWIWSKYTLPLIDHPAVPRTWYLSEVEQPPADLERFVLKPLVSFAGQGVQVDLTPASLAAIPPERRADFLLQEKVDYAPALVAPDGAGVKAEVRMMFLCPEDTGQMTLAINLARLSRGKMHGVDHNKGLKWVGSSVAIWPIE